MNWITLSLLSAFTLGFYEISRKFSLNRISPFNVLFFSSLISGCIMLPQAFQIDPIAVKLHGWILLKSAIICISWGGEFFALRKMQLTMSMAIRSCGPVLTLIIAISFFKEQPTFYEWTGISLILVGYIYFMTLAKGHKRSGILRYRYLLVMFAATILGTLSGAIDRYLLKSTPVSPVALQTWFALYIPILLTIPAIFLFSHEIRFRSGSFTWSWAIPCISLLLLFSDRIYFTALSDQDSSLAVVGALRRGSIIISAIGGGLFFGEDNMKRKSIATFLIFCGLLLLKLLGG